jgi:GTP-binding protein
MADHKTTGQGVSHLPSDDERAAGIEAGRLLFAQACRFVGGAASLGGLPPATLPEAAFAGRSNVGKSSLINALTGRRTLARVSGTPGRTQQINFFALGERLMLVDLPGYGFAQASKAQVAQWTELVDAYLKGRSVLRRACLLIDARHGVKDSDRQVMGLLDKAAVPYQVVLTKTDKIPAAALTSVSGAVADEIARRPAAHPDVVSTSVQTGWGLAPLRAALAALTNPS